MTRTASVALRNPANWNRAVPLSYEQFRYSFANVVGEDEAKELYLGYSVPGAGEPLFQAASANLNPWSEAKVNSMNPERGPMLIGGSPVDRSSAHRICSKPHVRACSPSVTCGAAISSAWHRPWGKDRSQFRSSIACWPRRDERFRHDAHCRSRIQRSRIRRAVCGAVSYNRALLRTASVAQLCDACSARTQLGRLRPTWTRGSERLACR